MLDIAVKNIPALFIDCNYWSSFVHEDERLLIGGLQHMAFDTIRNIPQSHNYGQYIKVLTILDNMIKGWRLPGVEPCKNDVISLHRMINYELDVSDENSIPPYIKTLFHHFLIKKTEIVINLADWKQHFFKYYEDYDFNAYGFKKFAKLFNYNRDELMIDIDLFSKLLPNAEVFTIGDFEVGQAFPSIDLSNNFGAKMLDCIECMSKSSKALSLSRIEIIKPISTINKFIENYQNRFEKYGWKLKNDVFTGEGIYSHLGSQQMLLIQKIQN